MEAAHNACLLGDAYLKLQRYIPGNPLDQLLEIRATAIASSYPISAKPLWDGIARKLACKGETRLHPREKSFE